MMQELFIAGQRVDLADDTKITLEYVSGLFSDIGKISLSRSYTIRLPKTKRNTVILDDPGTPAHESSRTRKYLEARYYRNGVDLLGAAVAYILRSTPQGYEIGLLWNSLPELLSWRDQNPKLTELKGLGTLKWVGASGLPDYSNSQEYQATFFAKYNSGLMGLAYPAIKVASHPCVTFHELLTRIMIGANIRWNASTAVIQSLKDTVMLVTGNKPSRQMEIESGSSATSLSLVQNEWRFGDWSEGWDSPYEAVASSYLFKKGTASAARIILNLKVTGGSPSISLIATHNGKEILLVPEKTGDGGYLLDETISMSDLDVAEDYEYFDIQLTMSPSNVNYKFSAYANNEPMFAVARVHDRLDISNDNRFPIAVNLPDMGQVEFIKGLCALLGLSPQVQNGELVLRSYAESFGTGQADDWTSKIDMTDGGIEEISYSQSGLARANLIKYTEDVPVVTDPTYRIVVDDETLASEAELYKLPFAASNGDQAIQYEVTWNAEDSVHEIEDVGIKPRVFRWTIGNDGLRHLTFSSKLQGSAAVSEYYWAYQNAVKCPVRLEIRARLTDIDLKSLKFPAVAYIGSFGRYYAILKVQTSDGDLCKVELLQIS